jgi:hypothetical protein
MADDSVLTGVAGATGAQGPQGPPGNDGQGVPVGGAAGQHLAKIDATDYNTQWVTPLDGPVASTDEAIARYDGVTGDLLQDSSVLINDAGAVAIGGGQVASSILTLTSTTQGMLLPRMTTVERDAIAAPATALTLYNTDVQLIEHYNGTTWIDEVPSTRLLTAGAGLTGGGNLSADRTFNVVANADGTIVVNADDIQVGTLLDANVPQSAVTQHQAALSVTVSQVSDLDNDAATLSLPANTTISAFGATLVDDADAATARGTLNVDVAGTDNSTDVTLAGTPDYITIVGQVITRNLIDLTTDVTGALPTANAGAPAGGAIDQVLTKQSASDYDYAWEDAGGGGVFGSEYNEFEALGQQSTSSGSYALIERFTTPSLPAGDYYVTWSADFGADDNKDYAHRLQLDNSTTLMQVEGKNEGGRDSGLFWSAFSGSANLSLSGVHDFDFDAEGQDSAYYKNIRLQLWRIA